MAGKPYQGEQLSMLDFFGEATTASQLDTPDYEDTSGIYASCWRAGSEAI